MDVYEQLRRILDAHPTGAPQSVYFDRIMRILFTPEEAAIAVHMSFRPKGIDEIAARAGLAPEAAREHLEAMACKAIIFSRNDGIMKYGLLPTIPGLFEFPFMKGGGTPMHDELGKLWEQYHRDGLGQSFSGNPTPLTRIVPVDKSITAKTAVYAYGEVAGFINNARTIALAECACRVSVGKCNRPKDVCLVFDGTGRFLIERGYAREISREEAMKVLDRAEEAGLVHTSNNSADRALLICNCCPCCCTVLRGRTELRHPHAFATSRFEAVVREDICTGCGTCVYERCPVKAIVMRDGVATVQREECIGCGLCATRCPSSAVEMIEREKAPSLPNTIQEMGLDAVREKGRLDDFIAIMQR